MSFMVFSWTKAILDSKLKPTTKLVLFALSTYMNSHGEGCYPSQETIAEKTSLSKRAVVKHIEIAISEGFLLKGKRNLRGKKWDANEYYPSVPDPSKILSESSDGVHHVHASEDHGVHEVHLRGARGALGGVHEVHINYPVELYSEHSNACARDFELKHTPVESQEKKPPKKNSIFSEEFKNTFWPIYPRKTGKVEAEAKFIIARRCSPLEDIMHGVQCLVDEKSQDRRPGAERFIPHARTWLHNKRWLDYAEKDALSEGERTRIKQEEYFPGSTTHC